MRNVSNHILHRCFYQGILPPLPKPGICYFLYENSISYVMPGRVPGIQGDLLMRWWQSGTVLPGSKLTAGRIFYILPEPFGGVFYPAFRHRWRGNIPRQNVPEQDTIPFRQCIFIRPWSVRLADAVVFQNRLSSLALDCRDPGSSPGQARSGNDVL